MQSKTLITNKTLWLLGKLKRAKNNIRENLKWQKTRKITEPWKFNSVMGLFQLFIFSSFQFTYLLYWDAVMWNQVLFLRVRKPKPAATDLTDLLQKVQEFCRLQKKLEDLQMWKKMADTYISPWKEKLLYFFLSHRTTGDWSLIAQSPFHPQLWWFGLGFLKKAMEFVRRTREVQELHPRNRNFAMWCQI